MIDEPAIRLTLFERLRWLVEAWPKDPGCRFTPKTSADEYDRLHRLTLGIAGWQALVAPGATLARAAGRQGLPEDLLAWWLTVFGGPEYAAHRALALEQLERWTTEHPGGTYAPAAPAFRTGDRYAGLGSGYLDGRIAQPAITPQQFLEYELLFARWLIRFQDFGEAGIFGVEGLDGAKPGRTIWCPGLHVDFIGHALTHPDGSKTHGVVTILTLVAADQPGDDSSLSPQLADADETISPGEEIAAPVGQTAKRLHKATRAVIDQAITKLYNDCKANGERIPNVKKTPKAVLAALKDQGFEASLNQIERIAGDSKHAQRRERTGRPKELS
jgi:hypothetical protein